MKRQVNFVTCSDCRFLDDRNGNDFWASNRRVCRAYGLKCWIGDDACFNFEEPKNGTDDEYRSKK